MKRVAIAVVVAGVLLTTGNAQTGRTATTPPLALESLTGRDSFDRYCASCHGAASRSDGPVAAALKARPADLTTLARRSGGTFERQQVASFIEGTGRPLPAHGPSEMPVWGRRLRGLESSGARVKVRIDNLVAYVESLQLPADRLPSIAAAPMSRRSTLSNKPRELSR